MITKEGLSISFVSLGCDKNLVDSEKMLGKLDRYGFRFTDTPEEADIAVVNTCCFIHDAKEESINTLLEMADLKDNGQLKFLIAAGCLAQRYREEIQKEIPQVDALIGTMETESIVEVLENLLGKSFAANAPDSAVGRSLTTGGHFAYLKIAEGCDKYCTYCVIPSVRGRYTSVPVEELVAEAKKLAEGGVEELILVAQETTRYGVDLYGDKQLPRLLKALALIPGIVWIRILYCYPEEITEELIDAIAEEPKICHYLDIPIQHASDDILKRMGRHTTREDIVSRIRRIRERIPDICLRTTLISGFPGETPEDHQIVMDFVAAMQFDRLGVFTYSKEEGTPAAKMKDQVPKRVKKKRRKEIMLLQQEIAFAKAKEMEGRKLLVMVEGKAADQDVYVTRTYKDAPEVDGYLFMQSEESYMTGDFVEVEVTGANAYDLIGVEAERRKEEEYESTK
jgi:ribosomal protein S12 methylthiotransferase